jgi:nucleoside-diphosphate-sugar epimerase
MVMAIMITGGGTVGSQVAASALEKNLEEVVLVDIMPDKYFIHSIANKCCIEQASTLDLPRMIEIVKKYDVKRIVHTAVVPEECENIYKTIKTNIIGTTNIFELARLFSAKRVINCSSAGVYDFSIKPTGPVNHDYPTSIKDDIPYYSTKLSIEAIARNYASLYSLDIITVRLAGNFGPSKYYNMGDKKWIYTLIKNALQNKSVVFESVAKRHLPWTYAKDSASCLIHMAYNEGKDFQPLYNCAYPYLYGLPEMIEALKVLIPGIEVNIKEIRDIGWKHPYDVSDVENDFGYTFKYGPLEAFGDYVSWLKTNPNYLE